MARTFQRVTIWAEDYERLAQIMGLLQLNEKKPVSFAAAVHWLVERAPAIKAPVDPEFSLRREKLTASR